MKFYVCLNLISLPSGLCVCNISHHILFIQKTFALNQTWKLDYYFRFVTNNFRCLPLDSLLAESGAFWEKE